MRRKAERRYRRAEVRGKTGLTEWQIGRGIREGLIDPPIGQRRGAYYTDKHIKQAQRLAHELAHGRTYNEIREMLSAGNTSRTPVVAEALHQPFHLPDGVAVWIPAAGRWHRFEDRMALADALYQAYCEVASRMSERGKGRIKAQAGRLAPPLRPPRDETGE